MRLPKYSPFRFSARRVLGLGVSLALLALFAPALSACDSGGSPAANFTPTSGATLVVTSAAFKEGQPIPRDYTCDGSNRSPAISWSDVPTGTRTLALIMEDPDAPNGTFTHWLLFNIPASENSLPEGMPPVPRQPDGSKQGTNSAGNTGYDGPCPPNGTHHYHFKLYALDSRPNLTEGASVSQLQSELGGHVLASGELVGTYSR